MTWPVEIRDRIMELVAEKKSLAAVCRMPGMPTYRTVMLWLKADPELQSKYIDAKEVAADIEFDEMRDIEDKVLTGELDPKAASVVLSSQQWRLDKIKNRVYGRRTTLAGDSESPVALTIQWAQPKE